MKCIIVILFVWKISYGTVPKAWLIFKIIFDYPDFDLPAFLKCLTLLGLTTKVLLLFRSVLLGLEDEQLDKNIGCNNPARQKVLLLFSIARCSGKYIDLLCGIITHFGILFYICAL